MKEMQKRYWITREADDEARHAMPVIVILDIVVISIVACIVGSILSLLPG